MIPETSSPLPQPQMAARRSRIAQLAFIVFELIRARHLGGEFREFDGIEDAGLMVALRACSRFGDHIDCLPPKSESDDLFIVVVEGIDGNRYLIEFSLPGPGFLVHAARVRVRDLSMIAGHHGRNEFSETNYTYDTLGEFSKRVKLAKVGVEDAFLVGMAIVIGFMDQQGEELEEAWTDLTQQITPRREELRQIRAKLPPSSINYDEEGELPY